MTVKLLIALFLLFGSCTTKNKKFLDEQTQTNKFLQTSSKIESLSQDHSSKRTKKLEQSINEISYKVKYMSAIDFLQRKGVHIEFTDLKKLEKEQVILFEIISDNPNKEIWEDARMKMSKEEAINYLGAGIINDFLIMQNSRDISPNEVSFEGVLGVKNRLRCILFFTGVNLKKEFNIRYYDRLFEGGMMRFNA